MMSRLLEAFDWFEQGMQNLLAKSDFPSLNKTQSMMMLYIDAGVQRPAELAKRLRISRQAIHKASAKMIDAGLVDIVEDENDKRGHRLVFSDSFLARKDTAVGFTRELENQLGARIGAKNAALLNGLLGLDWGDVPGA